MTEANTGNTDLLLNTRYGKISAPQETDLIAKFLRRDGEWAFLEAEFVASHIRPQARVLDIGAYLGTFTLGLAQFKPLSFACLAEGNSGTAHYLKDNVARNLGCQYEVLNAVVMDPSTAIGHGHGDADNSGSTSFLAEPGHAAEPPPASLATISFENLVTQYGPFDLIKADVEGMEEQLLASYPALLHASTPLLWVECNETLEVLSLAKLLLSTGRPLTYFAWPSHNPGNHNGNTEPIFPFAYEAGLLLGAAPGALTASQQAAGCILKPIHSTEDLKQCLWHTPRWAPREWGNLSAHEITGIAGHLLTGRCYETFLTEFEDTKHGLQRIDLREYQVARHKIRQLEDTVKELSSALRHAQAEAAGTTSKGVGNGTA